MGEGLHGGGAEPHLSQGVAPPSGESSCQGDPMGVLAQWGRGRRPQRSLWPCVKVTSVSQNPETRAVSVPAGGGVSCPCWQPLGPFPKLCLGGPSAPPAVPPPLHPGAFCTSGGWDRRPHAQGWAGRQAGLREATVGPDPHPAGARLRCLLAGALGAGAVPARAGGQRRAAGCPPLPSADQHGSAPATFVQRKEPRSWAVAGPCCWSLPHVGAFAGLPWGPCPGPRVGRGTWAGAGAG